MNWATMTRMDVVRRILYGGLIALNAASAATPSVSISVVERAHLRSGAHTFAKYFHGSNVNKLTPFNPAAASFTIPTGTGTITVSTQQITLCNASFGKDQAPANNITSAPSIFGANGKHALWKANERWRCYLSEEKSAANGNDAAITGLSASTSNPSRASFGLGTGYAIGSYTARVEVCETGLPGGFKTDKNSRCKLYPRGNYKPIVLLQRFGERDEAALGLMTGSFDKNVSCGVRRKNVFSFKDEVDIDDGQFKEVVGIVRNLNRLKIAGYSYGDGTYESLVGSCNFQQVGLTDGERRSTSNPIREMYLESVRYFAGETPTATFTLASATWDTAIGLSATAWSDSSAITTRASFSAETCRRTDIINFNSCDTFHGSDQWSGAANFSGLATVIVDDYTNRISAAKGLYAAGKLWSVGRYEIDNNGLSSDKSITATSASNFANITGICLEALTQYWGYKLAGQALWSKLNPIRTDIAVVVSNKRAFKINTFGVVLATGTPRIKIPVPGQAGKCVFTLPFYRLRVGAGGGGTLVNFKVVCQTATKGIHVINWEDSEQDGDFANYILGILKYSIDTATAVITATTKLVAQATANPQGFGYVIFGKNTKDGVYSHSGIIEFNYTDPRNITVTPSAKINASGGCKNCQVGDAATTVAYAILGESGKDLNDPLWSAAKYVSLALGASTHSLEATPTLSLWGAKGSDGSTGADGSPHNNFYAVDSSHLEKSLSQVFWTILKAGGSAPAATSAKTNSGGYVYQSAFDIKAKADQADEQAGGKFERFSFLADGKASTLADWDSGTKLAVQDWNTGRSILSLSTAGPMTFRWENLTTQQQNSLRKNQVTVNTYDNVTAGQNKLAWMRGDSSNETVAGGLRVRSTTKLGAIINSTPWYVGSPSAGYTESDYGGGYTSFRNTNTSTNAVFVGANDGMLHAIDGATGNELFAYVPRAMYKTTTVAPFSQLSALTGKDFALNHGTGRLTVDGSVMAADMKVGTTPAWATYLFGTFGRGGKGVYALDVTKPQNIIEDRASANKLVKWEFSDETGDPDMGYITGRPSSRSNGQPFQTGRMANGKWAAIFGNGSNSTNQNAVLYILYADGPISSSTTWTTGTHYIKIPTGVAGDGPDNGLSMPTAIDSDNNGNIDTIYAGDLKGNVWKFDVGSSDPNNWKVATKNSVPLYQARSTLSSNTATVVVQPITTVVQPFPHPNGGYQLVFGTGKSLETSDYPLNAPFTNTIYGIYDKPGNTTTLTVGFSELILKSTTVAANVRYVENITVDYSTKKGWYLNLPLASEALVFNPTAQSSGRISLKSIAPDGVTDGFHVNSISFNMDINPLTGNAIVNSVEGATTIPGFTATGAGSNNSFEVGRGGVYRLLTPLAASSICIAGGLNVIYNPKNPADCVECTDPTVCCPPWKPCETCVFRTLSALGTGGISTSLRYGSCGDGRLTWREILRNR